MMKKVVYSIQNCNGRCPHFYYSYVDGDCIWCDLLDKKIFDADYYISDDRIPRKFPKDCPLEDTDELLGNSLLLVEEK